MRSKDCPPGTIRVGICWGHIVVRMVPSNPNNEVVILDFDPDETTRWQPGEHVGFRFERLTEQLEPEEWKS